MTSDPNDGDQHIDILRKRDDSLSGALMGGIAIALLLLFGIAIFTLSSANRDVATTDKARTERATPAPSTTGRGGSQIMPGRDQNIVNPTPPAPPGQGTATPK
ncbi:MAG: hypothetical protein GEU95_09590 [Rhizobiales bacterium]|nr:hypothetical protein [Hyphomicrobiales bacterium]